ncbi:tetratricopeptide repeat protein [Nonomuraea sp. NPDC050786]|uniref:ATP-binding protein n=1 Tax=Nonomuraea sp. NPDC050786 TaxID=3154840 RepID=UPI0033DAC2B4
MAGTVEGSPRTELAQRLTMIRDLSGRSLRALERETGISSSSLSRYFSGQALPPWRAIVALCRLVRRDPRPLRPLWEAASRLPPPAPDVPKAGAKAGAEANPKDKAGAEANPKAEPRPRNDLPIDIGHFTGRERELDAVLALVRGARAAAIDGMAGVGKTCLAVHAAHLLTEEYPDGQLFLDLHGFTPGREPLDAAAALRVLLGALDAGPIPEEMSIDELSARWRAELSHRRAVIVLDNVADAEHARPLLPGAGSSVVLITSRNRLIGLEAVPPVSLDTLSADDGARLFHRACGDDRGERDPAALAEVVRRCGGLPLAIQVAAARLRHRPGWTVGVLAERLREGISAFDTAFGMSLRQLNAAQRRLFRLVGMLPGADFDDHVAAVAANLPLGETRAITEELLDAHLLQEPAPGRYRLHDLVREQARRIALAEERDIDAALRRVLDHYVGWAAAARDALPNAHHTAHAAVPPSPQPAPSFGDQQSAIDWFDREYPNLVAAFDHAVSIQADEQVSLLPGLMRPYFFRRADTAQENRMLEAAVAAARRLHDVTLLTKLHSDLGFARYTAGRLAEAAAEYEQAATLLPAIDDPELAANLAMRRGYLQQDRGFVHEALTLYRQAENRFTHAGHRIGTAYALAFQGWSALLLGRYQQAAELAQAALSPGEQPWPPQVTALVTAGLALARQDAGAAEDLLRGALAAAEQDNHLHNQAWCHTMLGVVLRHARRLDEALDCHRRAMDIIDDLAEERWAMDLLNAYAETCRAAGRQAEALTLFRRALDLARTMTYRREEALAHQGIAAILDPADPAAAAHRQAADAILRELDIPGVPL